MNSAPQAWYRNPCIWALLGLGAALWLSFPAARHPWAPDEARYLRVAEEMAERQSWVLPWFNDAPYGQKPPGFFWLLLAANKLTGHWSSFTAVLPTALAAIGVLLLMYSLARRMDLLPGGALLAAVLWATSNQSLWQGRFGQIDMVLLGCSMGQLYLLWRLLGEEDGNTRHALTFFLLAGLGTLLKGPVALLPQLLSAVVFCVLVKKTGRLKRLLLSPGWLIYGALVGGWLLLLADSACGEYVQGLVFGQTLERFVNPWHHFRPWYYYLLNIPVMFLPWFLVLPPVLWKLIRERGGDLRDRFLWSWGLTFLVFFSLSSGKRTVYVLAVVPVLALLLVRHLKQVSMGWQWPARALLALIAVVLFVLAQPAPAGESGNALQQEAGISGLPAAPLALMGVALVAGVVLSWVLGRKRGAHASLLAMAGAMAVTSVIGMGTLLPVLDQTKWAGSFAEIIRREVEVEKVRFVAVPQVHPGIIAELDRHMEAVPLDQVPLSAAEEAEETVVYLFPREKQFAQVQERFPESRYTFLKGPIGRKNIHLVIPRPEVH